MWSSSRVILDLLVLLAHLVKMDPRVWGETVDPQADRVMLVSVVLLGLLERREMLERMVPLWVCHASVMFLHVTPKTPLGLVTYWCLKIYHSRLPTSLKCHQGEHRRLLSDRRKRLHLFVFYICVDFTVALSAQQANVIGNGQAPSTRSTANVHHWL